MARTYTYETERACDAHLSTFLTSIQAAGKAPGQGFAAIKVPRRLGSIRRECDCRLCPCSCKRALCMRVHGPLSFDLVAEHM